MFTKLVSGTGLLILSILVAFVALLAFFLSPSGELRLAGADPVVKVYYADNISPAHQQVIDAFNDAYRGRVEVVPISLPFSKFSTNERKELLARALRSKNSRVDVFAVDLIWVPRFARWAEPFNPALADWASEHFLSYALESCYVENRLVALPLYLDIGLMYYQRDLLQQLFPDADRIEAKLKASITWEELLALQQRVPATFQPFYLFAADNFEGLVCSFMELVLSQDRDFFHTDSLKLNTPEGRKALQLLVDLVHRYKATPARVTEFDEYKINLYALHNNGLFWRGWPGITVHLRDLPDVGHRLQNLAFAALPHFRDGSPVSIFGGWNLMISRHTKHKAEALKFVQFMLKKQSQMMLYRSGGYLPVLRSVYTDSAFLSRYAEIGYYHELLKHGMHRPYRVDYTKLSDVISFHVRQAILREISVEAALEAATELINSNKVLVR